MALLDRLSVEIKEKRHHMQNKKALFHKCHKSMKTMVKLNELRFNSLSHPLYPLDLASSNYWLLADTKKMRQGRKYGLNKKVMAEIRAFFQSIDKSFYKKFIEKLKERWNEYITFEEVYVDE